MDEEILQHAGARAREAVEARTGTRPDEVAARVRRIVRRRRIVGAAAAVAVVAGAGLIALLVASDDGSEGRLATTPPATGVPAERSVVLWPDDGAPEAADGDEALRRFAQGVLGWPDPVVEVPATGIPSPVLATVTRIEGAPPLSVLVAPDPDGAWVVKQVGNATPTTFGPDGASISFESPPGSVVEKLRVLARREGRLQPVVPTEVDGTEAVVVARGVTALVVLFVDDSDEVIGAVSGVSRT